MRERCPHCATANVRRDLQLEKPDVLELDRIVLHLPHGVRRAERVLLADDVAVGASVVPRPPKHELLRPRDFALLEDETNTLETLRIVKAKPEDLRSRLGGTP